MGKKDVNRTLRVDANTEAFMVQIAGKLDCSVSQLIRASVIVGSPLLVACPSLIKRIDLDGTDKILFAD